MEAEDLQMAIRHQFPKEKKLSDATALLAADVVYCAVLEEHFSGGAGQAYIQKAYANALLRVVAQKPNTLFVIEDEEGNQYAYTALQRLHEFTFTFGMDGAAVQDWWRGNQEATRTEWAIACVARILQDSSVDARESEWFRLATLDYRVNVDEVEEVKVWLENARRSPLTREGYARKSVLWALERVRGDRENPEGEEAGRAAAALWHLLPHKMQQRLGAEKEVDAALQMAETMFMTEVIFAGSNFVPRKERADKATRERSTPVEKGRRQQDAGTRRERGEPRKQ